MKEVYLVILDSIYKFMDFGLLTKAFSSYGKAKAYFDIIVSQEKNDIIDKEDWVIEEDDDRFCAYVEGRFSESHSFVQIRELEIE